MQKAVIHRHRRDYVKAFTTNANLHLKTSQSMPRTFFQSGCLQGAFCWSGIFLAVLLASGCSTAKDQAKIAGRTYQNPVYAGDMPDPSVKRLGGYFYAFGTTGSRRLP